MENEEVEHLSEVEKEFAEQQNMVSTEETVDFPNNIRTQEIRPESSEAQIGKWIHENPEMFNESLNPPIQNLENVETQVALPDPKGVSSTLYADGVDYENKYISEIKPETTEAIESGLSRNQTYEERIEANTGTSDWSSGIHTYNREEILEQHDWMNAAYPTTNLNEQPDTTISNGGETMFEPTIQEQKPNQTEVDLNTPAFGETGDSNAGNSDVPSLDDATLPPSPVFPADPPPEQIGIENPPLPALTENSFETPPEFATSAEDNFAGNLDYQVDYGTSDNFVESLEYQVSYDADNNITENLSYETTPSISDSFNTDLSETVNTSIETDSAVSSTIDSGFDGNNF